MAVAIRGTTPGSVITVSNPVSLTLTGSRQPQSGDVLVIIHCNDFYALSNMPTPSVGGSTSGVTAVTGGSADGGSNGAHAIAYTYVVSATGDATVSVTETGSADEEKALVVYVLSGVDSGTPIDVAGQQTNTGATTHICPSISPTSSDAYLICHTNPGGGAAPASYTHPSGMTETLDTVSGGLSLGGAVLQLSASGATGTQTFIPSNSVTASANLSIAVKTASAAAPESSSYSPARLPGRIGPDRKVFLPGVRYGSGAAAPVDVTADTATLAFTGVDITATGTGAASVTSDVATLALTGIDPTAAGSGAASTAADVATLAFSGVDVTASAGATATLDTATLGLLGVDPVAAGTGAASVTADVVVLVFSGVDVTAAASTTATADPAVLTLTGVTSTFTGSGTASTAADIATIVLVGVDPTASGSGTVARLADPAVLVFSGVEISGFSGQLVTPDSRTYPVPTDPRTLSVAADDRTHAVPDDPRTLVVPYP